MLNNFKGGVTGFIAAQGNFNGFGRIFGSDNPTSSRYLGVPVQAGAYDVKNNAWINETKGKLLLTLLVGIIQMNIETLIF